MNLLKCRFEFTSPATPQPADCDNNGLSLNVWDEPSCHVCHRGRAATRSGLPSPCADPNVRRQAYPTGLFRHACDVASASPAAIAFREVGTAHSVRPTLSGQSLRFAGHGCLCWLRMPVSPLSRSGARRTVPMTERPRQVARPLPLTQGSGNLYLTHGPKGRSGGGPTPKGGDRLRLLIAATLAMDGWLDLVQ